MAIDYWNYRGHPTSTTGCTSNWKAGIGTTATSSLWYPVEIVTRKMLIQQPENWTDEQNMLFVELVNIHTKTGWTVEMVIKASQITITNPDIEIRKMIDFIPLLKKNASREDTIKINEFYEANEVK